METFKLISMTDFVLECDTLEKAQNYAKFLKQPLTLGMFVPCDESGEVLIESFSKKYKEAKERVLFKGFKLEYQNQVRNNDLSISLDTLQFFIEGYLSVGGGDILGNDIEALSMCNLDLKLTETAIKQLGL